MRKFLSVILAMVVGAISGVITALWFGGMISGGPTIGNAIDIDGWRSDWSVGSESANPYVRARVARNGLMGLRKEEAVYFLRTHDHQGDRLRENCSYAVTGQYFPANWWSITLYDSNNRLPMNDDQHLSFDQSQAEEIYGEDEWRFEVSSTRPISADTPWVSSQSSGEFDLTLRLYQPFELFLGDPFRSLIPPHIERLSCAADVG